MVKGLVWMLAFIALSLMVRAQTFPSLQKEKAATRAGNNEFEKSNYSEAESNYRKALEVRNNMPEATFNLGDAVYEQKRFDEAGKQFQLSAQTNADVGVKAKAYHNLGNTYLQQKKWEDAVKAYKNALKLNPGDQDTKYNLAYANAMLQKQNSGGQNQNQQRKDQQKQHQQNNQQQDQKNKQQDQQSSGQDKNDQQQKNQQAQQPKLSKEEAEQLLQALANEEQKTTQKVQQKNMKAVKVKTKKDW